METLLTDAGKITGFFPKHTKKMVNNFLLLLHCVVQSRTVCLYKCRDKISGAVKQKKKTKINSDYMRLIRFFKMKMLAEFIQGIGHLLVSIIQIEPPYLIMDRSNWKIGKKNVNLLTIGGLLQNTFLPFHWQQLDKRGNSNFEERKNLMVRLIELLQYAGKSAEGMILLADREFIGTEWFEFLRTKKISFVIRMRENTYGELSAFTGKKNFAQISEQTCREIWNLRHTHVLEQYPVFICNTQKSKARKRG